MTSPMFSPAPGTDGRFDPPKPEIELMNTETLERWLEPFIDKWVYAGGTKSPVYSDMLDHISHLLQSLIAQEADKLANKRVREARLLGAVDFASWIMNHDESPFRSDRSWYKIKPGLLLKYQANLMKELQELDKGDSQ